MAQESSAGDEGLNPGEPQSAFRILGNKPAQFQTFQKPVCGGRGQTGAMRQIPKRCPFGLGRNIFQKGQGAVQRPDAGITVIGFYASAIPACGRSPPLGFVVRIFGILFHACISL